jgi:effector-binding domain-containing protein
MPSKDLGIEHKAIEDSLVATIRANVKKREELFPIIDRLAQGIPPEYVAGPAFCIFQFISSFAEGFDAEIGVAVRQAVETGEIKTRVLPGIEALSLVHQGPVEGLRESLGQLFGYASEHAIMSDEFYREVYLDLDDPEKSTIELQFVIHNWGKLLDQNLGRVLGERERRQVMQGSEGLRLGSTVEERFEWTKGAIQRLDRLAADGQKYEILSGCAHVFPQEPIEKLRVVYEKARASGLDPLLAVDAAIEFMVGDPAWGIQPVREGRVIYATKNPRDRKAYEEAKTEAERRRAYCFCPLVRDHLEDEEMSWTFCNCSAGWERQQWEGALGRSVKVEIVKSLLRGDDRCRFAIQLPGDL